MIRVLALALAALLAVNCGSAGSPNVAAVPAVVPLVSTEVEPVATEPMPPAAEPLHKPEVSTEKEYSNRIKWKTASEQDNFGYDVYRGESREGPFEQINPEVIEGAGTTDEPTAYQYVDTTVDPYKTYYYYVESISMQGDRKRFTPIGKSGPKIETETDRASDPPLDATTDPRR